MTWARAEPNEAAAVFEAIREMCLIAADRIDAQLAILWRPSAMLTGLSRSARLGLGLGLGLDRSDPTAACRTQGGAVG